MDSITLLIAKIRTEDHREVAVRGLWVHYFELLTGHALKHLRTCGIPRVVADEEDVASRAFVRVWQGIESGRLSPFSREDLLRLFLKAVTWEAKNCRRHQQIGDPNGEQDFQLESKESPALSSEKLSLAKESFKNLLKSLEDEKLRRIAVYRLYGHTNEDIKIKLNCSLASIERKIKQVRKKWSPFAPERIALPGPRGASAGDACGGADGAGDFEGISTILNALLGQP